MAELFRYVQHSFVAPAETSSIDVSRESPLQRDLENARSGDRPAEQIREIAGKYLETNFQSPAAEPFRFAKALIEFGRELLDLSSPNQQTIDELITSVFAMDPQTLPEDNAFQSDKGHLDDALICVKLVTGFDRVNAARFVAMRQSIAFLEDFAAGEISDFSSDALRARLRRPIRVPQDLLDALKKNERQQSAPSAPDPNGASTGRRLADLIERERNLRTAYEAITQLEPDRFEMKPMHFSSDHPTTASGAMVREATHHGIAKRQAREGHGGAMISVPAFLAIPREAIERLGGGVKATLERASIDVDRSQVPNVVTAIKREWQEVSGALAPYQIPSPAKVFRVGANLFAVRPLTATVAFSGGSAPALASQAKLRPAGVGDLQAVRQELIGYEAGEISHIENVLEGELLRRSTRREEMNELTISEETDTTQVEERDQQSTSRNELSSEAQRESGQTTNTATDKTSTTEYGKLVENSKSNYARSVTDRAVNTLTQMVKRQRVQRERKTYTEEALHELDNREGTHKVRGIYQWVDKKYKTRIFNYGKRLLYDVVVPEPAAFLIDSLKNALQPENFQLTKPSEPGISPRDLNPGNYIYYAAKYGVTGSITPPPEEFIQTMSYVDHQDVQKQLKAFGGTIDGWYYNATKITVPENYKAVSGYVQRTNLRWINASPERDLEVYVGEYYYLRFAPGSIGTLNHSFTMSGETGDIPVTVNTWQNTVQFNFAIGINCRRTDKAYEQWQLKTHAAIMAGYQRQLAEYEDKLNRYQATMRSQMALVSNFAHDPSVEHEELKKAFIFLLLGEHFSQAYHPAPNPAALPPNTAYVKDWGAMVAFFERAFEWENIMFTYYPYFWGRQARWGELVLIQDIDPQFEAFLKAGAARVVVPVRPGFEGALAHYHETGDIWMGEEMPDMFSDYYVSIIEELKGRNFAPGKEICISEWDVKLPTTLVMLKEDATLPAWTPTGNCNPPDEL